MNTCNNCGTQNTPTAKFCKSCGTPNTAPLNTGSLPQNRNNQYPINTGSLPQNRNNPINTGSLPQSQNNPYQNSNPPPQQYSTGQLYNQPNTQNLSHPAQQMMPYQQNQPVSYMPQSQMSDVGKLMMFESNKKSATVALLLCWFLGMFGVHRFYLGQSGSGAALLCITLVSFILMFVLLGFLTIWISIIWTFIDLFLVSGLTQQYNNQLAAKMNVYN
jgi:TM2 domain-containing membrane protein YozV